MNKGKISFRLDPDLEEWIESEAKRRRSKAAQVIRQAVAEAMERQKKSFLVDGYSSAITQKTDYRMNESRPAYGGHGRDLVSESKAKSRQKKRMRK
jgi:hypothetical protein